MDSIDHRTTLYYYKIFNIGTGRELFKIGITFHTCWDRIYNTKFGKGWETEILWEIKMADELAYETEQFLKNKYSKHCSSCEAELIMSHGFTETFDYDITLYHEATQIIVENAIASSIRSKQ